MKPVYFFVASLLLLVPSASYGSWLLNFGSGSSATNVSGSFPSLILGGEIANVREGNATNAQLVFDFEFGEFETNELLIGIRNTSIDFNFDFVYTSTNSSIRGSHQQYYQYLGPVILRRYQPNWTTYIDPYVSVGGYLGYGINLPSGLGNVAGYTNSPSSYNLAGIANAGFILTLGGTLYLDFGYEATYSLLPLDEIEGVTVSTGLQSAFTAGFLNVF